MTSVPVHSNPLADMNRLQAELGSRAAGFGIHVGLADLSDEVPGEFDGPTITLNKKYDAVERVFYLAHSIGSIAQWSLDFNRTDQAFASFAERSAPQPQIPDAWSARWMPTWHSRTTPGSWRRG